MSASVQIRVDFGGSDFTPHTYIAVTHPDGSQTEYGLVPTAGGTPSGDAFDTIERGFKFSRIVLQDHHLSFRPKGEILGLSAAKISPFGRNDKW